MAPSPSPTIVASTPLQRTGLGPAFAVKVAPTDLSPSRVTVQGLVEQPAPVNEPKSESAPAFAVSWIAVPSHDGLSAVRVAGAATVDAGSADYPTARCPAVETVSVRCFRAKAAPTDLSGVKA